MSDDLERAARAAFEAEHLIMRPDEPIEWGRSGFETEIVVWQGIARAVIASLHDSAKGVIVRDWLSTILNEKGTK